MTPRPTPPPDLAGRWLAKFFTDHLAGERAASPRTVSSYRDAMKLLYLGLRNISSKRGGESGTGTHGWKTALNTLVVLFPGRLPL